MSELKNLPLAQLKPNPWNRTVFDPAALNELAANIKAEGVREPLKVRPIEKSPRPPFSKGESVEESRSEGSPSLEKRAGEIYQISSGHRRWLAAQKAGLTEVPCLIEDLSDEQVAEDNVTLNV